jgi:CHAT domain-containing protein
MRARLAVSTLLLWSGFACSRRDSPDTLYQKSTSLLHQGKLEEARKAAEAGFRREPSWRFRLLEIDVLLQIDARRALAEIAAAGDPGSAEFRARLEMDRGWANYLISNYAAAEAALNRAREFASGASNQVAAEIDVDRGIVLTQQGKFPAAEAILRAALAGIEEAGASYVRVRALGSLGWFFLYSHHPDEAIYWLERQRDLAAQMGAARQVANALGNIGSAYHRLGDYERALPLFREAEHRFEQLGDRRQQQVWLGNIGNVLLDTGEYAASIPIYARAAAIARALEDPFSAAAWEDNLANAYLKLGQYDEAERHNNEALRLKQSVHAPIAFPLVNRAGIAEGRGNFAEAEKLYREVLDGPSDDPVPLLETESGLAGVLVKTGQLARADAQFRSGIERVERRSASLARDDYKLSYLSSLIDFYQRYVDFLVDRGQVERAAEVAESSRARLLDERLNSTRAAAHPETVASFRQIARSSRAVVLSYWLAPNRSFLWVITPDAFELHVLPPEKEIARRVQSYGTFLENLGDPVASGLPDARQLSEILLGPVRERIKDGVRLLIAPGGALNSLNFETLPDPADPSRYLIDRATIAVAPSLDALAAARPNPARTSGLLLIGDPEPAVEEYPRLPNASREMKLISGVFGPGGLTELGGVQANPAVYRAAAPDRYSWIHFAAHASANRDNPLESALILSRHDGVYTLSAREVMEIPLNAGLVTLSACRGAGAKTYSGEGLVGLSWAFLRAGAQNVIAGLWDVTDTSTASLMADFYSEMMRGSPPADALRAAKLRLVHSKNAYHKPFYWAPFQLYARAASKSAVQSPRDSAGANDP